MAEFSRNRFFSSFPSGQMTFGVSTTELSRIYHGESGMSIQHETGKTCFKDKESGAGQPHTANKYPTQKDRKPRENTGDFAACTLLYTI